jgi:DNA polymerase I
LKWLVGQGFTLYDDQKNALESNRVYLKPSFLVKDRDLLLRMLKQPGVVEGGTWYLKDLLRGGLEMVTEVLCDNTAVRSVVTEGGRADYCWDAESRPSSKWLAEKGLTTGMNWDPMPQASVPPSLLDLDPYLTRKWFEAFEASVPRYLVAALDIETFSPGSRLADPAEAENPVIAVSLKGSDGVGCCWLLRRDGSDPPDMSIPVKVCDSEYQLLNEVFAAMRKYPVIVTHNGDEFDLPYLRVRALRMGFSDGEIPIRDGYGKMFLNGALHLDLVRWFDNRSVQIYVYDTKYKDMDLDSVAKGLIGRGKIQNDKPISKRGYWELADYCWNDADLSLTLATYDGQYTLMMMTLMSRLSGLFLEDVCRYKVSTWITNILQSEHRRLGCLVPNRGEVIKTKGADLASMASVKGKKFKGATVMDPVPGLHFGVSVYDFASLYPAIIETRNIGYATVNCFHEECKVNAVEGIEKRWVCLKVQSIESNVMKVLRALRVRYYKPLSKKTDLTPEEKRRVKAVEGCLKVVMNASYGVFGSEEFAFYYPAVAECITALGRYSIDAMMAEALRLGFKVLYGDTDSVFLLGDRELGRVLIDWAKVALGLDLEFANGFYWLILTERKKNYMGLKEDGKMKVMGMTGKKRNTPPFIRSAFDKVKGILTKALTREDFDACRREIATEIYSWIIDLRTLAIDVDALAFTMSLSMDIDKFKVEAQHVKAARMAGLEKAGSIVRFVKVRTKAGVCPVSMVKKFDIDVETYEASMRATFAQILESLGVPWPKVGLQTEFTQVKDPGGKRAKRAKSAKAKLASGEDAKLSFG